MSFVGYALAKVGLRCDGICVDSAPAEMPPEIAACAVRAFAGGLPGPGRGPVNWALEFSNPRLGSGQR